MKTKDVLMFWPKKVDLADFLKLDAGQISRFVRYGNIPDSYDKRIKQGIKRRMKELNDKANVILETRI